jgi:hypothetical protein
MFGDSNRSTRKEYADGCPAAMPPPFRSERFEGGGGRSTTTGAYTIVYRYAAPDREHRPTLPLNRAVD